MAVTNYSNWYSGAVGEVGHFTTKQTPVVDRVALGFSGARFRVKIAEWTSPATYDPVDNDVTRLMDVASGDRPFHVYFTCDANQGSTALWNYGLYKKGSDDDGAVLDEDLFASSHNEAGAIARLDLWDEAGTLGDVDRGRTFWELQTLGGGDNFTSDPKETWTITKQAVGNNTINSSANVCRLELWYIAG